MRTTWPERSTGGWSTRGTGRGESRHGPFSSICTGAGRGVIGTVCAGVACASVRAVIAMAASMAENIRNGASYLRVGGARLPQLLRRLGTRDAALIVMGGIVGSGIFMNPSVVARYAPAPAAIMLIWTAGGAVALLGAGIFAELAARRPQDGGLYAYLRDAFHPHSHSCSDGRSCWCPRAAAWPPRR